MGNTKQAGYDTIREERVGRRGFLRGATKAAVGLGVAGPLQALLDRHAAGGEPRRLTGQGGKGGKGYGRLAPTADLNTGLPLLRLPRDFSYVSFGWTRDPLSDGSPTPPIHDGMAVVAADPDRVVLVRNHEISRGTPFGSPFYDPYAGGGTTSLQFNVRHGRPEAAWASLSGTARNCAGGATPWGSWLTCEETLAGPEQGYQETHGWIFEVPAMSGATPMPLWDMGRFSHEAVAVDPRTGFVFETEDFGNTSGFYRFLPNMSGNLSAGGRLQMLKVVGAFRADLTAAPQGSTFATEWVDIADPTAPGVPDPSQPGRFLSSGVYAQGKDLGGANFARLEGCWYANGLVFINATTGGGAGAGQVWQYHPASGLLGVIFESPSRDVLNQPDNLAVSPRGGMALCEDGPSGAQRLQGLTADGQIFPFAQNNVVLKGEKNGFVGDFTGSEWAGVSFSPDGVWLFANIQNPGITFAITGPWNRGAF